MAPRASWKGYLKLSLVSCPVRLYPATSASERIRFNQLHKDTHNRINMKPVDPELGLVERSDLVKGYEYEDKQYIIIDESDLEAVRIESNHTMNIEAFVDEGAVDVIYQDAPYYLAPDGAMAEETFVVLREAMRKTGKVAIARLVLSSRERVVTIGAREKGMFVCTLRNPNEVRGTAEYFDDIPDGKPDPEMLELAEKLIEQKVTTFDPKNYEDRYEIGADGDDQGEAQGPQADHRGGARARQRHQPDGRAEGEPRRRPSRRQRARARPARPCREAGGQGAAAGGGKAAGQGQEVTAVAGRIFGIVGALAAFPRRLAAREVERPARAAAARRHAAHLAPGVRPRAARQGERGRDRGAVRRGRRPAGGRSARTASCACSGWRIARSVGAVAAVAARPVAAVAARASTCWRSSTPSSTTPSPSRSAT